MQLSHVLYFWRLVKDILFVSNDSDDDKILECAVLGNVDFIISGDSDLLSLNEFQGIPIMTASKYIEKVES